MDTRTLIVVAAIVGLAVPVAAGAKTTPVKHPAAHVKVTKTSPTKRVVPQVAKRGVEPRQLCVCVSLSIDRTLVQAQADFEAGFNDLMVLRGVESWQWVDDPAAVAAFNGGMAAIVGGTESVDEILAGIDASW